MTAHFQRVMLAMFGSCSGSCGKSAYGRDPWIVGFPQLRREKISTKKIKKIRIIIAKE